MRNKVVIFDFDGTLADVAEVVREIYDEESEKRGWPALTDAQYKKLRKGTIKQAVSWVGIRPWQLPGLLRLGRKRFHSKSGQVKLFPGITKLMKDLHDKNWTIYVLSANSSNTIREVLDRNDIGRYVQVLKRSPLFGKASSVRRLIRSRGYQQDEVWMVGDEVRDMEAAQKAGIRSIAVTWGLQDESLLKRQTPHALVTKPDDILHHLEKSSK